MTEYWKDDDYCVTKEKLIPVSVKDSKDVKDIEELLS